MNSDRRVRRTRKNLLRALGEIVEKKGYADIKVSEICETADINRATFYRHYEDKQDLLSRGIEQMVDDIISLLDTSKELTADPAPRITALFEEIHRNRETYRPFLSPNAPPEFASRLEARVAEYLRLQRFLPLFRNSDPGDEVLVILSKATARVLTSVLSYWLIEAPEKDIREIMELYLKFVMQGITGFLKT